MTLQERKDKADMVSYFALLAFFLSSIGVLAVKNHWKIADYF